MAKKESGFLSKIPGYIWFALIAVLVMVIFKVPTWTYAVVAAVVLLTIIIKLCKKHPEAKVAILVVACIASGGTAIYSGVYINEYLSAEGGIVGYIKSSYKGNQVVEDELKFTIPNITLKATNNPNEYSASIVMNRKLLLDKSKTYNLFLNDAPGYSTEVSGDHVNAKFKQAFYNKQDKAICEDVLSVYIAVYENYSTLEVSTTGGAEAIKYWNSFFNKNNCVLEIRAVDNSFDVDDSIIFGEGEIGDVCIINYYSKPDTLYKTEVVKKGSVVDLKESNLLFFKSWALKSGDTVSGQLKIETNVNFIATYDQTAMIEDALDKQSGSAILDLSEYKNLTEIPADSFVARFGLEKVILPDSVTKIGDRAFYNATDLTAVVGGNITHIGNYAFTSTALKNTNNLIKANTDFIGDFAFANCNRLEEVRLYSSIKYIGSCAFAQTVNASISINLDSENEVSKVWSDEWNLAPEGDKAPNIFFKGKDEKGLNYIPVNTVNDITSEAYAVWIHQIAPNVTWRIMFNAPSFKGEDVLEGIFQQTTSGFAGMTTTTTEFSYTIEDNSTVKLWTVVDGETVELMTLKYTHTGEGENLIRYLTNIETNDVYVGPNIFAGLEEW